MMTNKEIIILRCDLCATQQDFAKILGVSQITIKHWENDEQKPSAASLLKLQKLRNETKKYTDIDNYNKMSDYITELYKAKRTIEMITNDLEFYAKLINEISMLKYICSKKKIKRHLEFLVKKIKEKGYDNN